MIVLAVLLPFFFGSYRVGQFTQAMALAIAVLGLNLLVGYSGQISLGHGAFFALGAYASAISIVDLGVPYLLTLPLAGLVCALAGFLLGLPALRLRGLYLALVTLGAGDRDAADHQARRRADRRHAGPERRQGHGAPAWSGLADDQWLYFVTLAVAAVDVRARRRSSCAAASGARWWRSARTRSRRARWASTWRATRPGRSRSAPRTRASAARCSRCRSASWRPESFPLALSFAFLAAIVVGGLATIARRAVRRAVHRVRAGATPPTSTRRWPGVIYGGVLILFMYLAARAA